jgi:tetratricopeptide (TPR) repeat protein
LVLLLADLSPAENASAPEALDRQAQGIAYFKQREYRKAVVEFEAVLDADSTDVQVLYALGACRHNLHEYDRAAALFRAALARDPALGKARRALALALLEEARAQLAGNQHQAALQVLTEAAGWDSTNAAIRHHVGLVYSRMGRAEEAFDAYLKAAELDSAYAPAYAALGSVLLKRSAYAEAIGYLERAHALQRGDAKVTENLALAYERMAHEHNQQAQYAAAAEAARKSLEYDPQHVASRVALGEAYEGSGDTARALEQYRVAVRDLMWEQYVEDRIKRLTGAHEEPLGD